MNSWFKFKIFLAFIFLITGCSSKYYKNPDNEHVLRINNNRIQEIRLINFTDTNLYYHYNASVSGASPLFGDNNEFIRNFRYVTLGAGRDIILQIRAGEILKIRYKKIKSEIEEKYEIDQQIRFEVKPAGIIFVNGKL